MARQFCKLDPKSTLFLLCDIQEKFRPVMKYFDCMVTNVNKLILAGKALEVPLLATEQYPEKLGNLVKEIDTCHASAIISKTKFSMIVPEIEEEIKKLFPKEKPRDIVLFGIEAHVCVEHTAIDCLAQGYNVHLVADCSMSRLLQDRDLALVRLRQMGCNLTTSESVIFSLLQDKNHPKFNDVRKLVAKPSEDVALSASKL